MSRRSLWPLTVALLSAAGSGCDKPGPGGESGAGADTSDGGETGDSAHTGGPGGAEGPQSPEIVRAAAWCQQHTTGTKYWVWFVEAEADDPQGVDTLLAVGSPTRITKEGALIDERQLVCSGGYCIASWEETGAEPLCAIASQYLIELQIADVDLNYSEPTTVKPTRVE